MDDCLNRTDAAFWHLESPAAPMHLGALALFEYPEPAGPGAAAEPGVAQPHTQPTPQTLARLLCERAARVPLLRQKVRGGRHPAADLRWVPDPAFDAHRHVHLHPHDGDRAPEQVAADLMATPLNPTLPPWEVHLLPRPQEVGGPATADGFALLFKFHHAAVDGLRAVELGARLLDQYQPRRADPTDATPHGARPRSPAPRPAARTPAAHPLLDRLTGHAQRLLQQALIAADVTATVLTAALDPGPRPLHTPPTGHYRLALPVLALDDINRIRKQHGGTVNDILLTLITAALRTWLTDHGHHPDPGTSRILVPVSTRHRNPGHPSGNQLSGYLLDLPVHHHDPLTRLHAVQDTMRAHKARGPRQGPGAVALLADLMPPLVTRLAAPLLRHSVPLLFDALVTNVPVPDLPLSLGGAQLAALHPLAPLAPGHTLAIAMTTYRRTVHLGIRTTGPTDPDHLERALHHALTQLLQTCNPRRQPS